MTTLALTGPSGAWAAGMLAGASLPHRLGGRGSRTAALVATLAAVAVTFTPVAPLTRHAIDRAPVATDRAADAEAWPAGLAEAARSAMDDDAYALTALAAPGALAGAAWEAANPAQGLSTTFSSTGVSVEPVEGGWTFGLTLNGYGYDGALAPPAAPDIVADANRVEYRRGTLTEWYANDARGIEQGFTLDAPPRAGSVPDAPLVVELGLTGDLAAALDPGGDGLTLTGPDASLRYDGLVAYDATGRDLPAHMALDGSTLRLEVDDRGATYPLTIDPLVYMEQAKLTASDVGPADVFFARAVAVDGSTAVVGASYEPVGSADQAGAAYVFVRDGGAWSEQARLTASDAADSDFFGESLSISGDTVVVGSYLDDTAAGIDAGSAHVFVRTGGAWSEQAKLTAADADTSAEFGESVAIDDNVIIIGAPRSAAFAGGAYVFERTDEAWEQTSRLNASDSAPGFGVAVDLSEHAAIIGADSGSASGIENAGSAYVFVQSDESWVQQAKLIAHDAAPADDFGRAVTIDGDIAVVGAPFEDDAGLTAGAAYAFVRSDNSWVQEAKLVASDTVGGDFFGRAVSASNSAVLIGAFDADTAAGTNAGAAYLFTRTNGNWIQTSELVPSDGAAFDVFGFSVALADNVALVGAHGDNTPAGGDAGSAYVFDLSAPPAVPAVSLDDVDVVEGDSGKRTARFTVSLSETSAEAVSVRVATASGTARASIDYVGRTTFVSFAPGQTTATFDVKVKGDTVVESDETFSVRLDRPQGATLADAVGTGTILDDD